MNSEELHLTAGNFFIQYFLLPPTLRLKAMLEGLIQIFKTSYHIILPLIILFFD
jgi:hypothetical protein